MLKILTIVQTCEILKSHGMGISPPHLRAGLECGVYPFGVAINMGKSHVYEIYKPLLMQWIKERSEEESA